MAYANYLENPINDLFKATVASVPTTYGSVVPTSTAPTSGMLGTGTQIGNRSIMLFPFINTAPGANTFAMRLIGWQRYVNAAGTATWYFPQILANLTLTIGSTAYSIDGTNDVYPATEIAASGGASNPKFATPDFYTPGTVGSIGAASVGILVTGCRDLQVQFTASAGAPTMGVFFRDF